MVSGLSSVSWTRKCSSQACGWNLSRSATAPSARRSNILLLIWREKEDCISPDEFSTVTGETMFQRLRMITKEVVSHPSLLQLQHSRRSLGVPTDAKDFLSQHCSGHIRRKAMSEIMIGGEGSAETTSAAGVV